MLNIEFITILTLSSLGTEKTIFGFSDYLDYYDGFGSGLFDILS